MGKVIFFNRGQSSSSVRAPRRNVEQPARVIGKIRPASDLLAWLMTLPEGTKLKVELPKRIRD